jgi:homoserine O-acetyltransferase/O-succinyltransferase
LNAGPVLPVTGAWRPGDPPGRRQFVRVFDDEPLALETGGELSPVTVAYETFGELDRARSNAVLVLHALTADSHVAGPPGDGHAETGWWDPLVGPGKAVDTDRYFVVCPNVLGGCQGTTGPSSIDPVTAKPFGSRFPMITIRDQVTVEVALADALGIDTWASVIGASMGAQRVLEWAIERPARVRSAVVIAVGAVATAEQIALCALQIRAIEADPKFRGGDYYSAPIGDGPWRGMSIARGIGTVSYRSEAELAQRFGRAPQDGEDPLLGGRYAVESYLDHQGVKLARRFDANSYVVLSRAMNHHDVGRDRGGVAAALARIEAHVTLAGIDSDRLYPLRLQEELADLIPDNTGVQMVESVAGHDAFLIEHQIVGKILEGALRNDGPAGV